MYQRIGEGRSFWLSYWRQDWVCSDRAMSIYRLDILQPLWLTSMYRYRTQFHSWHVAMSTSLKYIFVWRMTHGAWSEDLLAPPGICGAPLRVATYNPRSVLRAGRLWRESANIIRFHASTETARDQQKPCELDRFQPRSTDIRINQLAWHARHCAVDVFHV